VTYDPAGAGRQAARSGAGWTPGEAAQRGLAGTRDGTVGADSRPVIKTEVSAWASSLS